MTELMTLKEVAAYLRVTKKTIYRLLKRDSIPATKISRQWRFNKALIDEWLHQNSDETKASILVIDDEETIRLLFQETLGDSGHRVVTAETGCQGLELIKKQDFDLVFLDLKMPGMSGTELFRRIKTIKPKLPVTIITGHPDSALMKRVLARSPFGVMNKPFGEQDIVAAVTNFLRITQRGR